MKRSPATDWESLPLLLSVKETAAALGFGESTLYKAIKKGGFPVRRLSVNGKMFFSRDGLRAWLEQPTNEAASLKAA